jgi:hypothetical protein
MPAHILAASPIIHKELVEWLWVHHVEVNMLEGYSKTYPPMPSILHKPKYLLPLLKIDITLSRSISEPTVLNPGLQIIIIWRDLAQEVNMCINSSQHLEMEGANSIMNWTLGCAEYLSIQVRNVPLKVHAHVVEKAPFHLLLGHPFQCTTLCHLKVHIGCLWVLSVLTSDNMCTSINPLHQLNCFPTLALMYKRVVKKVCPIPASLPEDFCCIWQIPEDLLLSLPPLLHLLPDFTPHTCLTLEWLKDLQLNANNFLHLEELKVLHHILKLNKFGLPWMEDEKGCFRDDYSLVKIPVIEHVPWAHCNIPIPTGILDKVIQIFKDKFAAGIYKHSDALYQSHWFCVKKKSGVLHLVHNL